MSKFVNYQKRAVTLPSGCKNLIDLLHPRQREGHAAFKDLRPSKTHQDSAVGRLNDIGRFIDRLHSSSANVAGLRIASSEKGLAVSFLSIRDRNMPPPFTHSAVEVEMNSAQEEALRSFYGQRGMKVPDTTGPVPAVFFPGIRVCPFWNIEPLPADAPTLALLVVDLFREVCGLNQSSDLCFEFEEEYHP